MWGGRGCLEGLVSYSPNSMQDAIFYNKESKGAKQVFELNNVRKGPLTEAMGNISQVENLGSRRRGMDK